MNLIWNQYTRNLVLRFFQYLPLQKGQVMCVCWGGAQYNCNPRAIVEQMASMQLLSGSNKRFSVYFAFLDPQRFQKFLPRGVQAVEIGSYDYYKILATSQFIISNTRLGGGLFWPMPKRRGQIYIQTMHGGHGMKKQELEVANSLSPDYVQGIYRDSARIDLMISDSRFWSEKARTIFSYPKGEMLEEGLPRNDIFFTSAENKLENKRAYCEDFKINYFNINDVRFLVYCPTFRNNYRQNVYGFQVDLVLQALHNRFGGAWYLLISSHPNMQSYYQDIYDFSNPCVVDIGAKDLSPILAVSDVAITDYSSAGFEFALTKKPCFLLCRDLQDYDRGVYFDMHTLPFPYAETDDQLVQNILQFNEKQYQQALEQFNTEVIGLKETGHASEAVVAWMLEHLMK